MRDSFIASVAFFIKACPEHLTNKHFNYLVIQSDVCVRERETDHPNIVERYAAIFVWLQ